MSDFEARYPIYIVSKGRADTRYTSRALERMGVPYSIVVEQDDYADYAAVIDPDKVLVLPESYLDDYDVCDDLGRTKSTGPGAARNFVWDHSIEQGATRHWVIDDNISYFYRFNRNRFFKVLTSAFFRAMEDFCDRYDNVSMAGPNYFAFVSRRTAPKPFVLNTRIYSCNLIQNDTPYRWRGRYNEDTDLSIRMLKDGWCTVLFNAFLQNKLPTSSLKGGNTDEFYDKEGTYPKSAMQVKLHPGISRIVHRFSRIHHVVDYSSFAKNALRLRDGIDIHKNINEYGMKLRGVETERGDLSVKGFEDQQLAPKSQTETP